MSDKPRLLALAVGSPWEELNADLKGRQLEVEPVPFSDAEEEIDQLRPDLILLVGIRGAMELSTLIDDDSRQVRPRIVIVAEGKEIAKLRGLNREIVVSVLSREMGERVLAERIETIARRWARVRQEKAEESPPSPALVAASRGQRSKVFESHRPARFTDASHEPRGPSPNLVIEEAPPPPTEAAKPSSLLVPKGVQNPLFVSRPSQGADVEGLISAMDPTPPPGKVGNFTSAKGGSPLPEGEDEAPVSAAELLTADPPGVAEDSSSEQATLVPPDERLGSREAETDGLPLVMPRLPQTELDLESVLPPPDSEPALAESAPSMTAAQELTKNSSAELPFAEAPTLFPSEMPLALGLPLGTPETASPSPPALLIGGEAPLAAAGPLERTHVSRTESRLAQPGRSSSPFGKVGLAALAVATLGGAYYFVAKKDQAPARPEVQSAETRKESAKRSDVGKTVSSSTKPPGEPAFPANEPPPQDAPKPSAPASESAPSPATGAAAPAAAASSASAPAMAPGDGANPFLIEEAKVQRCEEFSFVKPEVKDLIHEASQVWAEARALVVKGQVKRAHELMCQAVFLHSESAALEGLIMLLVTLEAPSEALRVIAQTEALRPLDRETQNLKGDALSMLGKTDEALAVWLSALNLKPEEVERRRGSAKDDVIIGRKELKRGDLPRAERLLRRAAALDPDNAFAFSALAEISLKRKRLLPAQVFAEKAITLFELNPDAYLVLGEVALERKDSALARKHFERALSIRSDFWPAKVRLRELGPG